MTPTRYRARERWRFAAAVVVAGMAIAPAACGISGGDQHESDRSVTIGHPYGKTTIDGIPERIVTLGSQWLDASEALGVSPVGYLDNIALSTGVPTPWEPPTLQASKPIDPRGDIVAQVAELKPDLIFAPGFGADQELFDKLRKLAPTIPNLTKSPIEDWAEQVDTLGKILDRQDKAKSVIADLNGRIDSVANKYPGLKGKSYVSASMTDPTQMVMYADPKDGASRLFSRFGMELPQKLIDDAGDAGRVVWPPDRASDLTADVVVASVGAGLEPTFTTLPGYANLPSVQKGSMAIVDPATGTGLTLLSALSIPYVLARLEPALANAAGGSN